MRIIWLFLLILLGSSCNQPTADLTNEISYKQRHTFHPQFSQHDKNPAILVIPERDNVARKLAMAGYVKANYGKYR